MDVSSKSPLKWKSLKDFLDAHTISQTNPAGQQLTMTEFSKFSKRKFHIKPEDEDEFQRLYMKDVIKPKKDHHLIQRQFIENGQDGVLLVDVDFRFHADQTARYYTLAHISELIHMYLEAIQDLCEMDEDIHFQVIIMEKPAPRVEIKNEQTIVKDGIHMIINLEFAREHQLWLQRSVVSAMKKKWEHFPITNTNGFEDVLDDSICSGKNGWLLPYSKKQDDVCCYEMTQFHDVHFDLDENKWIVNQMLTEENKDSLMSQHYRLLFPRYKQRPSLLIKDSMLPEIQKFKQQYEKRHATTNEEAVPAKQQQMEIVALTYPMILSIQKKEDLDACVSLFLETIPMKDYELQEVRELVLCLPDTYYGPGSYNKWIQVGFALHNMNAQLLIVWIEMSAKSSVFVYSQIHEICDTWKKMAYKKENNRTSRSLVYWAKQENPEEYEKIQSRSLKHAIDLTVESTALKENSKKGSGCTDCDLAHVLHVAFRGQFVSAGIKDNIWYGFENHRWVKSDSGTSLRKAISSVIKPLYFERGMEVWQTALKYEPDTEEHKKIMVRATKYMDIAQRLGSSSDKDKIMKEAKELFYDPTFLQKLDQNKYLFCCANGVIDFENKVFRKGNPEDYISISSPLVYTEIDEVQDKEMLGQIEHYLRTLFPIKEVYEYVLEHLASLLIGDTTLNQCLHYYTGIGKNGKSALVNFIRIILGDYANELDASFYTSERQKRGVSSPELYALIGKRFAFTNEITEDEKMNEGPMKQLTSGTDPISCRPLFGQLVQFIPQVNAVICANHYLKVQSRDHGTWRRIRVLKFVSYFTNNPVNNDPDKPYQFPLIDRLDEKFKIWAPFMLAWMVKIAFRTGGIVTMCKTVKEESEKYQKKQDYLMEFVKEHLVNVATGDLPKNQLLKEFNDWYRSSYSSKTNKSKEIEEYMEKLYGECVSLRDKSSGKGWKGVMLKKIAELNGKSYGDEVADEDSETDSETVYHKNKTADNLNSL